MVFWPGLPVREAVRRWARVRSERCSSSSRRGKPESEAGAVPPWPCISVGDLDRLFGSSFRFLGRPRSCVSFAMSPAGPSLCWEAGP